MRPAIETTAEGARFYITPSGLKVPSATTIVGDLLRRRELERWMQRMGPSSDRERDEAAGRGKRVHQAIARCLRDPAWEPPPHLEGYVQAAGAALRWTGTRPLFVEQAIVSEGLKVGGTIDLLGRSAEGWVVLDWKTSKRPYPEHGLQLGIYALLAEAELGIPVAQGLVVVLGRDGTWRAHQVDLERAKAAGRHLIALWWLLRGPIYLEG